MPRCDTFLVMRTVRPASNQCGECVLARSRLLGAALISFIASGVVIASPAAERYEASHDSMGTVFTIVAYGPDREALVRASNAAFDEIDRLDAQMSNYRPDSELSRINRLAASQPVVVETNLFDLISYSVQESAESRGAFDITVGPMMKIWGFFGKEGSVPTRSDLARARKRVGYRHIHLDAGRFEIRFDVEGLELDLGGIAKGYAVDRAVAILRNGGVEAAMISSGGSSIYALGAPPGERAWRVHLRDPLDKRKPGETVWLKDYSMAVSGCAEKSFTVGGKTYCHILDPRTGRPVEGMLMVAVLAPTGLECEALSKPLFVLKPDERLDWLKKSPAFNAVLYASLPRRQFKRVPLQSEAWKTPAASVAEFAAQTAAEKP
jgi:FAD:protein FMN transferase